MKIPVSSDLILRPFENSDAPAFVEAVRESARSVGAWLPWCHARYSLAEAEGWFDLCQQYWQMDFAYEYGIFSLQDNSVLGGIAISDINKEHHFANIGYWVRDSRQRQGIAVQCVQAVATFGFTDLRLWRLEIVAALSNRPSRRVAEKAGAVFEGIARQRLSIRGRPHDAAMYSLIAAA